MLLLFIVPLRPAVVSAVVQEPEDGFIGRLAFADLDGDVRISSRGFAKPLPYGKPRTFVLGKKLGALEIAVVFRVKGELRLAHLHEPAPGIFVASAFELVSLVEPPEQIAHRVTAC